MKSLPKLLLVIAIAHLLAVLAFAAWLVGTGRVDMERIDRVRAIFQKPVAVEAKERKAAEAKAAEAAADADFEQRLRELPLASADRADTTTRTEERIGLSLRAYADETRRLREELLRERDALDGEIDAFRSRKTAWEESIAADVRRVTDEQFRKAVRLLESMPPKQGKEWILDLVRDSKTDVAVAYLDAMSGSKAANLLKSFKGEEETSVATELLERVRMLGLESEARAERTDDAESAEPSAESARTAAPGRGGGVASGANRSLELPGATPGSLATGGEGGRAR